MPIPTRPAAGADVETDWGQEIHDRVFAPKGTRVRGAATSVGSTVEQLPLEEALDDPGGWHTPASHLVEVPTDGGGLYLVSLRVQADESDAVTRFYLYLNGAAVTGQGLIGEGSTSVAGTIFQPMELADGDQLTAWARRGTGADPDVRVLELFAIRVGDSLGA